MARRSGRSSTRWRARGRRRRRPASEQERSRHGRDDPGDARCSGFVPDLEGRREAAADTLADFDRALDCLTTPGLDSLLEEAILGVIRALDKPRSPAGAAAHSFYSELYGRSAAFRAEFRRRVLAATLDDLRAVAARHLVPARGVVGVVTHAGESATIEAMGLPQFHF